MDEKAAENIEGIIMIGPRIWCENHMNWINDPKNKKPGYSAIGYSVPIVGWRASKIKEMIEKKMKPTVYFYISRIYTSPNGRRYYGKKMVEYQADIEFLHSENVPTKCPTAWTTPPRAEYDRSTESHEYKTWILISNMREINPEPLSYFAVVKNDGSVGYLEDSSAKNYRKTLPFVLKEAEGNEVSRNKLCENCRYPLKEKYKCCPKCGKENVVKCKNCGKMLEKEWKYCPFCKEMLNA